jgi:hypothetical protein
MKGFFQKVAKLLARFYNWLPSKVKIAMYVATSTIVAGLILLLIKFLTNLNTQNEIVELFITAIVPVLTIIANIFQKMVVDYGTKLLALEDDTTTIDMLKEKVVDTKALIKSSVK